MNMKPEDIDPNKSMRWFYVAYSAFNEAGRPVIGHMAFWNQSFPSMLWLTQVGIPANGHGNDAPAPGTAVVVNLYEFKCEQDYADFVSGADMDNALGDLLG